MTEEELDKIAKERTLLCPFCPKHPMIEERYLFKLEYVMFCPMCGLTMKEHDLETLIRKWNTRYYGDNILVNKGDISLLISSLNKLLYPVKADLERREEILDGVVNWLHECKDRG